MGKNRIKKKRFDIKFLYNIKISLFSYIFSSLFIKVLKKNAIFKYDLHT